MNRVSSDGEFHMVGAIGGDSSTPNDIGQRIDQLEAIGQGIQFHLQMYGILTVNAANTFRIALESVFFVVISAPCRSIVSAEVIGKDSVIAAITQYDAVVERLGDISDDVAMAAIEHQFIGQDTRIGFRVVGGGGSGSATSREKEAHYHCRFHYRYLFGWRK